MNLHGIVKLSIYIEDCEIKKYIGEDIHQDFNFRLKKENLNSEEDLSKFVEVLSEQVTSILTKFVVYDKEKDKINLLPSRDHE